MKTRQHSCKEYNVNESNFGNPTILSMQVNVSDNVITPDIAPSSIDFMYSAVDKNGEKLLVCKIEYDNNGKNTFKIQLVKDLLTLFSESYFAICATI